jgi:prepilin-type processing-associated H-X9-DG protein
VFTRLGYGAMLRDITDGTSVTVAIGEVLPDCNDHAGGGWWNYNSYENAHASMLVPLNDFTTCANIPGGSGKPTCSATNNWDYSWGFRSRHVGGAHMLFCDGSVHFLSSNISGITYRALGGKADGNAIGNY